MRQALGLLEAGAPVQDVVQVLLGSAQAEVGRRWEANRWSVADEHAATAITDAVLGALAALAPGGARRRDPGAGRWARLRA